MATAYSPGPVTRLGCSNYGPGGQKKTADFMGKFRKLYPPIITWPCKVLISQQATHFRELGCHPPLAVGSSTRMGVLPLRRMQRPFKHIKKILEA